MCRSSRLMRPSTRMQSAYVQALHWSFFPATLVRSKIGKHTPMSPVALINAVDKACKHKMVIKNMYGIHVNEKLVAICSNADDFQCYICFSWHMRFPLARECLCLEAFSWYSFPHISYPLRLDRNVNLVESFADYIEWSSYNVRLITAAISQLRSRFCL